MTLGKRTSAATRKLPWIWFALCVLMLAGCSGSTSEGVPSESVAAEEHLGDVAAMVATKLRGKQASPPRRSKGSRRWKSPKSPRQAKSSRPSATTPTRQMPARQPLKQSQAVKLVDAKAPVVAPQPDRKLAEPVVEQPIVPASLPPVDSESFATESFATGSGRFFGEENDAQLILLPPVDELSAHQSWSHLPSQPPSHPELVAMLLPPRPVESAGEPAGESIAESVDGQQVFSASQEATPPPAESPLLATGIRTEEKVNDVATAKIRRGYALAERGAFFAARQEFIQVLRMISRAKDAEHGSPQRTVALAKGLRALDEAEDFAARGTQLEADLDVAIIASSHRTPVVKNLSTRQLLPQQLMDQYYRYAQIKLAEAVAREPAGSMALHALGKLHRRQSELEPTNYPLAHRRAFVFQQAALMAHDNNHLAAHELGVLLADAGHYAEAERLLQQVVRREPNPVVFRNLAIVQKKQGHFKQAAENDQQATLMAQRSGRAAGPVQWVTPAQFAQASDVATRGLPVPSSPMPQASPLNITQPVPNLGIRVAGEQLFGTERQPVVPQNPAPEWSNNARHQMPSWR